MWRTIALVAARELRYEMSSLHDHGLDSHATRKNHRRDAHAAWHGRPARGFEGGMGVSPIFFALWSHSIIHLDLT